MLCVTGVTPPKLKLLFSSPKTIFCHWPNTVEVGDLPSIPESYKADPEPAEFPNAILNWTAAFERREDVWNTLK